MAAILSSLEAQITEQRAREAFHRGSRERHAAAGDPEELREIELALVVLLTAVPALVIWSVVMF